MTDVTTKLIHDTFVQNRPDNVGREEAEELFNHWLELHGFQPEKQPAAPTGFEYETIHAEEDSTPSPDDLDAIALASDSAVNSAAMLSDVLESMPDSSKEALVSAVNDFDCAAEHLQRLLDGYDYKPLTEREEQWHIVTLGVKPVKTRNSYSD